MIWLSSFGIVSLKIPEQITENLFSVSWISFSSWCMVWINILYLFLIWHLRVIKSEYYLGSFLLNQLLSFISNIVWSSFHIISSLFIRTSFSFLLDPFFECFLIFGFVGCKLEEFRLDGVGFQWFVAPEMDVVFKDRDCPFLGLEVASWIALTVPAAGILS